MEGRKWSGHCAWTWRCFPTLEKNHPMLIGGSSHAHVRSVCQPVAPRNPCDLLLPIASQSSSVESLGVSRARHMTTMLHLHRRSAFFAYRSYTGNFSKRALRVIRGNPQCGSSRSLWLRSGASDDVRRVPIHRYFGLCVSLYLRHLFRSGGLRVMTGLV